MSTSTTTPQQPRAEATPEAGQYDQYIEDQLDRTRFHVKLIDLTSSLMVLVAAVVSILLVLAIIDHWIVSFPTWARWLAMVSLLAGVAWYVARVVVPLVFGRISSVYAARTIEQSEPSLKNSLINFLMFRSDRAGLRTSIYQAIRHQAASDLSHLQVDTAVDRGGLIKIGYVLAGVLALFAAYTILSPKSTFQSANRVIAPWADTAAPSRVRIEEVRPGNKEVYHGEPVTVSADCYDVRPDEPVTLFYSTLDDRLTGESMAMQPGEAGLRYRGLLSPDDEGIQQDLVYWIEAGDARSPAYRLTVLPAPTILVERIEYDYPAYTRPPKKKPVERKGDIEGLEGTRVTVHASANVPIGSAEIEFDPHDAMADDTASAGEPSKVAPSSSEPDRLALDFDGKQAWGSFVLELDGTRMRPKRSFYRIRFSTEEGQRNRNPVLHRIKVTRDLSPEIEILTPTRDRIEVPEDGHQKIELRGVDPDYGLSRMTLRAVAGGHDVTTATLLDDSAGQTGQVVVGYEFKPSDHGLRAGDAVAYWAIAEDNRTSPASGDPEPNTAKTRTYHMLIVPSEKKQGPDSAMADQEDPLPDPSSPPSHPQEPMSPDAEILEDGSTERPDGEGQEGDQDASQGGGEGEQASSDSSDSESGETGQEGSGGEGSGTESKDESGSGTGSSEGGQNTGGSGATGGSPSEGATGEGGEGSSGGTPSGQSGDTSSGQQGTGGEPGSEQQTGMSESSADPTGEGGYRQEPLHDGEAFERALEHMRQQQGGEPSDASSSGQASGDPKPGDEPSGSQSPEGEDGGEGQKQPPQDGATGGSAGAGQEKDGTPKPQSGQESESSGGTQQQNGTGPPKDGQQQQEGNQGTGQRKEGASGSGGKPKGGAKPSPGKKPTSGGSGKPKDSGQGDDSKSGTGQKSQDESGSPGAQQENRDQQKKEGSQSGNPKPGSESQSPSHSKRQSDSSGGQEGDRSGGGKEGGGQGAKQQGNDSSGNNSPGDEGKGMSSESGAGEESNREGDRAPSDGETGTPGAQKGHGSATDPLPGGEREGGTAGGPDNTESTETISGKPATGATDEQGQGIPLGGGKPSSAELRDFDLTGEVPPGEKPNLEYARKAANLVLENLKDQQDNPDQELLDKLGWTEEQMQEFIARWESMKRAAAEDEVGKRELDEALRSLGLRPRRGTTRSVDSVDDQSRGLRDLGGQSGPPPSIQEQFNAYKKGTARIGSD